MGTAAVEKHTEVTVDKDHAVPCSDRGMLLGDKREEYFRDRACYLFYVAWVRLKLEHHI